MNFSKIDIEVHGLFNDSYEYVLSHETSFFSAFYENFIANDPEIQKLFSKTDMEVQASMLRESIALLVTFFISKNAKSSYLMDLATLHANMFGYKPELYDKWVESLIKTLGEEYPTYTPKHGLAWRVVLAPGLEFLKHYPTCN